EDGLVAAVSSLLRRAPRGVALHDVQLVDLRVVAGAVRQLAGEDARLQRALLPGEVARLARRLPRPGGGERLLDDDACGSRVLLQELEEALRHHALHRSLDLAVPQLGLGLPL